MKHINDLIPQNSNLVYRYEVLNVDGTSKSPQEFIYLKYSPGALVGVPTPINAALLEDLYGYSNENITVNPDGSITKTTNDNGITITENTKVEGNVVTTTKTDGTSTITVKVTVSADGKTVTKEVTTS